MQKTIILGTEIANAKEAELKRILEGKNGKSSMPIESYDKWPDEKHLYNPILNALDSALCDMSHEFEKSSPEDRINLRKSISMDEIYTLLLFSKRVSIFAIRTNDPKILNCGLNSILNP
jgi:hypothetical protein